MSWHCFFKNTFFLKNILVIWLERECILKKYFSFRASSTPLNPEKQPIFTPEQTLRGMKTGFFSGSRI